MITSCSAYITNEEQKESCRLKRNMIAKALNRKLVKAIASTKDWKRKKGYEVHGYGRGFILVKENLSNQE